MTEPYDLAVIGAGAGGLSVTAVAARLGLRVALIERGTMGGDCLNTGCVPSKALLAAAHLAEAARGAGRFGIDLPAPAIGWAGVRAHVRGVIADIAPANSAARYRALGAEVIAGTARFLDPATLAVNDPLAAETRRIRARRIVIAAGSRPVVPPIPGLDQVAFLTNETLFDLAEPPAHLLILGGGPVGLEMADAHAGLGCAVTLVEAGRIAGKEIPNWRRVCARRSRRAGSPSWKVSRWPPSNPAPPWCSPTGGGSRAAICWLPPAGAPTSSSWRWRRAACAPPPPGSPPTAGCAA